VDIVALEGVSLKIARGARVGLMGPSGSGKSTLLNLFGGIDQPNTGDVWISGQSILTMNAQELCRFRNRKMGFIFQSFNLIPVLSVFENVEYPLLFQRLPKGKRRERVEYILNRVGLLEYARRKPDNLSGGQRQRVAIARALVTNPEIVFSDEATANLDHKTGRNVMDLLVELNQEYHTTLLFSTHDPMVAEYADTIVKMEDGTIKGIDDKRIGA
jgi:putative ABC transport system ATP-binding protein